MNSIYGAIYQKMRSVDNEQHSYAISKKVENVAVCMAIIAYSRMVMYDFVVRRRLISQLLYWDTDSLITLSLTLENAVGKMGKKTYTFYQKREYKLIGSRIITQPWTIKSS